MHRAFTVSLAGLLSLTAATVPASANDASIGPAALSPLFALPFAGLLVSIACLPMLAPRLWHRYDGTIVAAWALAFAVPFALAMGWRAALSAMAHAALIDYLPFVLLLTALFTVAGGITLRGSLPTSTRTNLMLIGTGTLLASVIGTTGASMVMIRPLIRANEDRPRATHVVVFFIFLVSNVGGALSPLGDPPLFLGYVNGVDFFWPIKHLLLQMLFVVVLLGAAFVVIDQHVFRTDAARRIVRDPEPGRRSLALDGRLNLVLLGIVVATVWATGIWQPGISLAIPIVGVEIALQSLIGNAVLAAVIGLSLALTPNRLRDANAFSFAPMREVAILFAGIFVTIIPVLALLQTGRGGLFGPLFDLLEPIGGTSNVAGYFWITGLLSSLLDNAPTYLVFFNLAGGDAAHLTSEAG